MSWLSRGASSSSSKEVLDLVLKYVHENEVMVFSKSYCPIRSDGQVADIDPVDCSWGLRVDALRIHIGLPLLAILSPAQTFLTAKYCNRAKSLLNRLGVKFRAVELDVDAQGSAMQSALRDLTRQSTVPNIFIRNRHVGGCDDIHAAEARGALKLILEGESDEVAKLFPLKL
ncbi:glutaredoxin-domain-containing protein [Gonapodya prolifera JEL478]|uniref:Glutaredoxin-domain-containing protein n=1 Tax=Gonapodya prolifera (strain JEL478) TaxID=1344416 RepID=A0A139AE94_GONPJ|nr:glutaredoxin-domain-containing protein [Gonapodya prolifera JEL478]|eukprot:KXS14743.1 glutaredoxin-domain-containing protein [Gonapodya prolifera JEL478]